MKSFNEKILDKMADARIFTVDLLPTKREVIFIEKCDDYFDITLNKSELSELITELQKIYDDMI